MKVLPFKIPKPLSDALIFQEDRGDFFYDKYHQHEEIQISHIVEGEGTLVVGETINNYKKGSIVVIGSNLPHVFKSATNKNTQSLMHSLFFTQESFGKHFFELEELKPLRNFFKRAENGFIAESNQHKIRLLFEQQRDGSKFERFTGLLELLNLLSKSQYVNLSNFVSPKKISDTEGKRISAVMEYTMNHFNEHITLEKIAQIANMSKNAFCKYFKRRTNKTYFQFLNELRVASASKLMLQYTEMSIAEIAESCGYNNLSNFNRQFKSICGMSPSQLKNHKKTESHFSKNNSSI